MIPAVRMVRVGAALLVVAGAAALVLGAIALVRPSAALPVLGLAFGLWLLATGLTRIVLAVQVRSAPTWYRGVSAALGVALVAAAAVALLNLAASAQVLAYVIGLGFLLAAAVDLVLGLSSGARGRRTLGLAVLHALVGVLFLTSPGLGLAVITVLLGVLLLLTAPAALIGGLVLWRLAGRAGELAHDPRTAGPGPGHPDVVPGEIVAPGETDEGQQGR